MDVVEGLPIDLETDFGLSAEDLQQPQNAQTGDQTQRWIEAKQLIVDFGHASKNERSNMQQFPNAVHELEDLKKWVEMQTVDNQKIVLKIGPNQPGNEGLED